MPLCLGEIMPNLHRQYQCVCAVAVALACVFCSVSLLAQSQMAALSTMPRLVMYNGVAKDASGKPLTGTLGVTFALYSAQEGGAPLWLETQNVRADLQGRFSVYLGATKPDGLPQDLFVSGEARWLGVRPEGQGEQPRAQLITVPYAMKAGDAETIGGLPPSAFVLAAPATASGTAASASSSSSASAAPTAPPLAGSGTLNFVPLWTPDGKTLGNSVLFQSGTGSTAKIGVNTNTPVSTLDVKGSGTIRGTLNLPATGNATAAGGKNSQVSLQTASSFNSGTNAAVPQNFRWQAEPAGNNTTSPSGTLNLLFNSGANPPAETGLHIASNGQITFAAGQAFPGTGNGTITGVTAGTDLTGGGANGSVTLNLDTTKVPQLNSTNTFTANQTVNGTVTATSFSGNGSGLTSLQGGSVQGNVATANNALNLGGLPPSSYQLAGAYATLGANTFTGTQTVNGDVTSTGKVTGAIVNATSYSIAGSLDPFLSGSEQSNNAFLGFAGNSTTTGINNIAAGPSALYANTSGGWNTAVGPTALTKNTTGASNAALGTGALGNNTTGGSNTAVGGVALTSNITGSYNTGLGYGAGPDVNSSALTNATAVGAFAVVSKSNALVLGGTGANAVNVGIGTATPNSTLDVHGAANFTGPITFAAGQTFPGAGTITGVTAGTGLSGGGTSGAVPVSLNTSYTDGRYAQLAANNTFSGVQTINNSVGIGTVPYSGFALQAIGTIRSETGGLSVGGSAPVTVDAPFIPGGRFAILPNGNVGINKAAPATTLDVGGNVNASGSLAGGAANVGSGGLSVGGNSIMSGSLKIGGDTPMSSNPHMSFSGMFPGSFCGDYTCGNTTCSGAYCAGPGGYFVPDKRIAITRMSVVVANTVDLSCYVVASVSVNFPGNGYGLNIYGSSHTLDSGPIFLSVPAGTPITIGYSPAYDCNLGSSGGGGAYVNVQYVMQ